MKKLFFIILLVVGGCTQDYKDIEPEQIAGTSVQIDSTQWTPAMIKVDGSSVMIYENNEIRKVSVSDVGGTVLLILLVGLVGVLNLDFYKGLIN